MSKLHPFEAAGMGRGPYSFIGMWSFPSKYLAGSNPDAYNNAMRDMPRNLVGGCGTCSNCGMGISNVCIVQDADGKRYGVGSDCVMKTDDASLGNSVKIEVARHKAWQARVRKENKRAAAHAAWLKQVCSTGETNEARLARESKEREAAQKAEQGKAARIAAVLAPIAQVLRDGRRGFRDSVASDLERGVTPYGRGLDIMLEIYAKTYGRYNSAAYWEGHQKALAILDEAKEVK